MRGNMTAGAGGKDGNEKGFIANIQDYSVHDGYGIRTLIFFKGCPLHCPWCQNPEAINSGYELMFRSRLCIGCFKCEEVCPANAIIKEGKKRVDAGKCTLCKRCTENCPSKALTLVGREVSVAEVMKVILSYKPFFDASEKGGVTISGGEPTYQAKFVLALLKQCRENGIHTAMETCGYKNFRVLKTLVQYTDLLLYDVKHMDDGIHKKYTGVSNKLILQNLKKLAQEGEVECVVRIPLIPGFNDSEENVERTARFVSSPGIKKLDLLPFNEMPSGKYNTLGKNWAYKLGKRQSDEVLGNLKKIVESKGLEVTIGGLW